MSKTSIPEKIKTQLWTLSAGRCEYRGCNKPLWKDELSMAKMNNAYIAHIVADSTDGPRGDAKRSPLLAKSFSNLMLMCDAHHRLIDKEDVDGHPESLLIDNYHAVYHYSYNFPLGCTIKNDNFTANKFLKHFM